MIETMEDNAAAGQINTDAAEIYEQFFVPALFGQFAAPLAQAAGIGEADQVLDVACGTGVAARAAAESTGDPGTVTGIDRNPGMLAVARSRSPRIAWRDGRAEALPMDDDSCDAVICQFGLMFFDDPARSLSEMRRVLKSGRHAAVAIWDAADTSPGYAAMIALLDRMFGPAAADALRAPFATGAPGRLDALLTEGGWADARVTRHVGTARFESIAAWVKTEIRGWTLSDMIDDQQFADLHREAERELSRFTDDAGRVSFAAPALFAVLET